MKFKEEILRNLGWEPEKKEDNLSQRRHIKEKGRCGQPVQPPLQSAPLPLDMCKNNKHWRQNQGKALAAGKPAVTANKWKAIFFLISLFNLKNKLSQESNCVQRSIFSSTSSGSVTISLLFSSLLFSSLLFSSLLFSSLLFSSLLSFRRRQPHIKVKMKEKT